MDIVAPGQPEHCDLLAHPWHKLLAKLLRENKFPVGEFRDALAVLAPDTEESVLLFLQLTQSSGRPIGRFKSLKIYRIHASLVVWLASSICARRMLEHLAIIIFML